jgi:hypothetical protein
LVKTETLTTIPINVACRQHKKQSIEVYNLGVLVKDYLCHYADKYKSEERWWAESLTWEEALERAWNSCRENGKMHSHQCHVADKLPEGLRIALDANVQLDIFTDFHQLYIWVKSITTDVKGLGDTTTYDVAQRLGVWMKIQPELVYLHAGAAKSAKKLGIKGESVPLSIFPDEIQRLGATHAERFLCKYKDQIAATTIQNGVCNSRPLAKVTGSLKVMRSRLRGALPLRSSRYGVE